jgi:hypothetical protein
MAKLALLSVLIATIALPILLAERQKPRATLRLLVVLMIVVIVTWAQLCLHYYPSVVPLD